MSSDNQNPSRASTLRRPSNCSLPQITACVKLFFTNSPLTNTLALHISYKNNQQTPNQHSHRDTNLISMSLEYIQNIILKPKLNITRHILTAVIPRPLPHSSPPL